MGGCCRPGDYDKLFDEKNARAKAREYARKGLNDDALRIVDFVRGRLSPGYSVLEVGGGVGAIPSADVVVMQRVVCCYPDVDALVGAAADHARRLLLLTFPVERWWIRVGLAAENALFRLRGSTFRSFVHSTATVLAVAQRHGMRVAEHHRGLIWQVVALERTG